MTQTILLRYDPRLIEEAVFLALRNHPDGRQYQKDRERAYEIADARERDRIFGELNQEWLVRLRLNKAVEQSLAEQPGISSRASSCFIGRVAQSKEEGAELFVSSDEQLDVTACRIVSILLRPESMLQSQALLTFLRHELFHIADMLDPAFAYEPALPKAEGGPTYDTLITNRYRALWDVTINGRMIRRGWLAATAREQQLSNFLDAFPMLEENPEELFKPFFDCEQPKHAELVAFAFDPRAASGVRIHKSASGTHCPLCRFPTHAYEPEPDSLGAAVLQAITEDFPNWNPSRGLCVQCADLYRGRRMSMDALRLLPGWNPPPREQGRGEQLAGPTGRLGK
jgi:hypothetical protein